MDHLFAPLSLRSDDSKIRLVPPSPQLLSQLYARYLELQAKGQLSKSTTFVQFFNVWSTGRRGESHSGLDDGHTQHGPAVSVQRIDRPAKKLKGVVRTLVLLVDFPDQPHAPDRTSGSFEQMLFSDGHAFPSGSMRDYYQLVSGWSADGGRGIDVTGEVHGWFRMPNPLSFYADGNSGTGDTFPRNAQGMVRDAVIAAKAANVSFAGYDALAEGLITALFVIHAGRGAEETGDRNHIWSHKWVVPGGVDVAPGVKAQTYLTVPEDCKVGVCAHEWGHLAARWADYYDTGEHQKSNGLGDYCLMASGSWGDGGLRPTFPNGMLRMFHDWIAPELVTATRKNIVLRPAAEGGNAVVVRNDQKMKPSQYILVEYRRRRGQDAALPCEGIAIYAVDEAIVDVNDESKLAIELLQADNKRQLALVGSLGNRGDGGDLFPFNGNSIVGKSTHPALNMPGQIWSGVTIAVKGTAGEPTMSIDVKVG